MTLQRKNYAHVTIGTVALPFTCTGCGSTRSIEELRAAGFLSCCPERDMQPRLAYGTVCHLCDETLHEGEMCDDLECPQGGRFVVGELIEGAK